MLKRLQLKDIFIGNTDAKNELLRGDEKEIKSFKSGFLMPDNVVVDQFTSGQKFYITGLKGTGKTALLRYLGICVQEQLKASIDFVLFKSDIREEERARLIHDTEVISKEEDSLSEFKDFERAWMLFLFQRIVKLFDERKISAFEEDSNWRQFRKLVLATLKDNNKNSLFPRIKKGRIGLRVVDKVEVGADVDFEWPDFKEQQEQKQKEKNVDFVQLVSQCESLFNVLKPGKDCLYLFIDELEVSFNTAKQYKRDVEMIRDLILAIYRFNSVARKKNYKVFCITGIRKEVLAATQSTGKEINKPIADFGINLRWQQTGGDRLAHPLIKIIIKRIQFAESNLQISGEKSSEQIWSEYFPAKINNTSTIEFLINKTWHRPRDIVRILGIAQQQFPNEKMFAQHVFEAINKDYSMACWSEQEEELQAKYSKEEIGGIKHMLTGISCPFTYDSISAKAQKAQSLYNDTEKMLKKYKLADILDHLFRLGIIGNTGRNANRFAFRGDDGLLIDREMTVHPALKNVLSVIEG